METTTEIPCTYYTFMSVYKKLQLFTTLKHKHNYCFTVGLTSNLSVCSEVNNGNLAIPLNIMLFKTYTNNILQILHK